MTDIPVPPPPPPEKKRSNWKRFIPIVIILAGFLFIYFSGLYRYISFDSLQAQRQTLLNWTTNYPFVTVLSFIGIYLLATAFSFPGATILTITSGFLFGIIPGTLYVVIGATLGSCIIFLAAKTAFAEFFEKKAGGWVKRFEKGFKENAFGYLLFLRLLPIFPFWLINIVPGLLNVPLRIFFFSTFLGIIPGTAVYVAVGNGLGSILDKGQTPDLGIIFEPEILIPLVLLALLSIVPTLYRKLRKRKH